MKNLSVPGLLWALLVIGSPELSYPQAFLAGRHNPNNYFVDIDPDTTLTGPYIHAIPSPPATYDIDINGDGVDDLYLYSIGWWSNGSHVTEVSIRIHDTGTCQVALGHIDTCFATNHSNYTLRKIARSLKKNDTLNGDLLWLNTNLYLEYTDWIIDNQDCDHNGFINDSAGNYIAARMVRPNDTLYGWIRVTNVNTLTYTVQEFACSKNSTGIDEHPEFTRIYPNPAGNYAVIVTPLSVSGLVVYDQYGKTILQRSLQSNKTQLDTYAWPGGVYIFKFFTGDSVIIKKLIIDRADQ